MKFIAVPEIGAKIGGPLIGLSEKHSSRKLSIQSGSKILHDRVRLWQIFAIRALPFHQVRNRVQAECVHSHFQPELHHVPHLFAHGGIVVVQIRLMAEKAVPIVLLGNWVPSPVGELGIQKDDSRATIPSVSLTPDVPIPFRVVKRTARLLKPRMLIRSMVQHHLDDYANAALVGRFEEDFEII